MHYLYDGQQAIAELRNGAISAAYHPGIALDEVLARYTSQGERSLLQDALNSVIAQTDGSGLATNWRAYSPYGETQSLGPDENNPLQYTGRENDRTGLYYYRARYYDPVLKRFISEDPIGLAGGVNVYTYVDGNSISYTDPEGLKTPIWPGPQPAPIYRPPVQSSPYQGGRAQSFEQWGEFFGGITGAGSAINHPSIQTGAPGLRGPNFPRGPGCVLICPARLPNQCSKNDECQVYCGPTVKQR